MTAFYILTSRLRPAFRRQDTMSSTPLSEPDGNFIRPIAFESQVELYAWLAQMQLLDYQQVDALSLTLILKNDAEVSNERATIFKALHSLPNVRSVSLYKSTVDRVRAHHHALYNDVLWELYRIWPKLEAITAHTEGHHLGFLLRLHHLRILQFTGYSASSPMETSIIMRQLRHLTSLEIIPALGFSENQPADSNSLLSAVSPITSFPSSQSYEPSYRYTPPQSSSSLSPSLTPRRYPSLTRDVLYSLRGLRSFTLRESRSTNSAAPAFFTSAFLQTFDNTTSRHSLLRLTVALTDLQPDPDVERLFCQLLVRSGLRHVNLSWPATNLNERWGNGSMGTAIMEALPRNIMSVRVSGLGMGEGVLTLAKRRAAGELRVLERVTVVLTGSDRMVSHFGSL
jgi:hypothetical protein